MNYNIIKYQNGDNFTRKPHSDHISRVGINKEKEKLQENLDKFGEIPRKIAKICGVKNLDRAQSSSVEAVLKITNLVEMIKNSTSHNINEILATLANIRRRETLRKKRSDRFKILENNLTITYLGEDFLLEEEEF